MCFTWLNLPDLDCVLVNVTWNMDIALLKQTSGDYAFYMRLSFAAFLTEQGSFEIWHVWCLCVLCPYFIASLQIFGSVSWTPDQRHVSSSLIVTHFDKTPVEPNLKLTFRFCKRSPHIRKKVNVYCLNCWTFISIIFKGFYGIKNSDREAESRFCTGAISED